MIHTTIKHFQLQRFFGALILFWGIEVNAQHTLGDLKKELDALGQSKGLKHAQWGFVLHSLTSNKQVLSINSDRTYIPASTLKTVTTAAALEILGPDFTFSTHLEADAALDKEGVLPGNLIIKGGGDPGLGGSFSSDSGYQALFAKWANSLVKLGVKRIAGHVVGDGTYFDGASIHGSWQWMDIGNYFGSGVGGLNIADNLFRLTFRSEKAGGKPTIVGISPKVEGLEIENRVTTQGNKDQAYIYGGPGEYHKRVEGSIPSGKPEFTIKGSLPEPPLQCAQLLLQALTRAGIMVEGKAVNRISEEGKKTGSAISQLLTHRSEPLSKLVMQTNTYSLNHYADALLKKLGKQAGGSGNFEDGSNAVIDFWKKKGMDVEGLFMVDGSGMSTMNGITPEQLTFVFNTMKKSKNFGPFYSSLSVAGVKGTLSDIGKSGSAYANVHAKTGTMTRVQCYTGYLKSRSGEQFAFTLMINHYSGDYKSMRDKVGNLLNFMCNLR